MEQNTMRLPPLGDALNREASPSAKTMEPLVDANRSVFPPPPSYTPPPPPTRELKATVYPPVPVPTTELPPIKSRDVNKDILNKALPSLPSLASVTGTPPPAPFALPHRAAPERFTPTPPPPPAPKFQRWPSVNPYSAYYTPSFPDETSLKLEADKTSSPESHTDGRASSVSLDDPDVRMAAEALGHLKTVSSPPPRNTSLPPTPRADGSEPEPLLSLLTVAHPLLAKTIEGTTSAYTISKNKSPRFVKSGVEYMEGYLTPISGAIDKVGKATGVEGGVRWYLGGSRRSKHHPHPSADPDAADGGPGKRRRVESGEVPAGTLPSRDLYDFSRHRRLSMSTVNTMDTLDTLPAYDDVKSPAYSEAVGYPEAADTKSGRLTPRPTSSATPPPWQQRLIMSTSGLSIAMSEESLRSLKYCLSWIRWANEHIGTVVAALTKALEQLDGVKRRGSQQQSDEVGDMDIEASGVTPQERMDLAKRIAALQADVLKTLQSVVHTVSNYAGGALPENARILIRHHLTSLPQRFHLANQNEAKVSPKPSSGNEAGDAEADQQVRAGAHKVLVLAMEGLDMMSQVSGVLDGTIVSAEEWCERLGRKKKEQREDLLVSYTKPPTVSAEEFQKRLNLQPDQPTSRDVLMQG